MIGIRDHPFHRKPLDMPCPTCAKLTLTGLYCSCSAGHMRVYCQNPACQWCAVLIFTHPDWTPEELEG